MAAVVVTVAVAMDWAAWAAAAMVAAGLVVAAMVAVA